MYHNNKYLQGRAISWIDAGNPTSPRTKNRKTMYIISGNFHTLRALEVVSKDLSVKEFLISQKPRTIVTLKTVICFWMIRPPKHMIVLK